MGHPIRRGDLEDVRRYLRRLAISPTCAPRQPQRHHGCTRPGCTAPAYLSEVHHIDEWAAHGRTDIHTLTFACGPCHKLVDDDGWTTRKNADGITEWIPPPHSPASGGAPRPAARTNGYWHLQRYFRLNGKDDDGP